MRPRVLLVHGAATTSAVWAPLAALLDGLDLVAPDRPSSGDLDTELAFLAPLAEGAVVVGVSGGATLGLALAASDVALAGAVLHEPAVGSLVPGLLDHVVAGHEAAGVEGFGRALYGPGWSPAMAPADPRAVARDLAMFRAFEPGPVAPRQGPVVVTVGGDSPPVRHVAARALADLGMLPEQLHLVVGVMPRDQAFFDGCHIARSHASAPACTLNRPSRRQGQRSRVRADENPSSIATLPVSCRPRYS